jgi:predicted dehydrogenase
MSIQFGIIGCRHAHVTIFIEEMLALGHLCVGVYEKDDPSLAGQLAQKYNIPLVQSRDVFLDDSVTVIGSAAINSEKIEIIEWCEQHGKHIMVDKPAVTDRDKLDRLEAVIRRGRIQVGMLLTERYRPAVCTLKRSIEAGELGQIVSIMMRKPHRLNPSSRAAWHFSKEQNGGIVIDLFVHDFDLLRWLTGQEAVSVKTVVAKNELPEYPGFLDTASAQVVMSGGAIGMLYADWHTPDKRWTWGDCRIFVNGTKGFAELRLSGDPSVSGADELYLRVTDSQPLEQTELVQPDQSLTADFLSRIRGERGTLTHDDVLATSRLTIEADVGAELLGMGK